MIGITRCSLLRTTKSKNNDIGTFTFLNININNIFALFGITFKNPIINYVICVHFKELEIGINPMLISF
ncbi:hypothetical protein SAMN05443253_105268 [Bacillus sp. OK048]|nr:hypothetical protein SAMN05443253_105268 [Bacillus sp. OK048]